MIEKSNDDSETLENRLIKKYIESNLYKVVNKITDKVVSKITM
jgi:hypothetical protein